MFKFFSPKKPDSPVHIIDGIEYPKPEDLRWKRIGGFVIDSLHVYSRIFFDGDFEFNIDCDRVRLASGDAVARYLDKINEAVSARERADALVTLKKITSGEVV
jgi:hypothetical protein